MPADFAMPVAVPSTSGDDAGPPVAARVAAGPGLWEDEDWLADLRRESLPGSLLAGGTIAAAAGAEHQHKQERALNAEAVLPHGHLAPKSWVCCSTFPSLCQGKPITAAYRAGPAVATPSL